MDPDANASSVKVHLNAVEVLSAATPRAGPHGLRPWTGRTIEVVSVHQTWGEYRVFYTDDDGALAAMPVNWTDVAEPFSVVVSQCPR